MLPTNRQTSDILTERNEKNNPINVNVAPIGITQGRYNVVGQPLPNDICIEIDDIETGATVLEVIFEKIESY